MSENNSDNFTSWDSSKYPEFSNYLKDIQIKWLNEFNGNHKDYIKETFFRLVGLDFYRFIKLYNKQMKFNIDSVNGLSDYLFGSDENSTGRSVSDIFLRDNIPYLKLETDINTQSLSIARFPYYDDEIEKVFTPRYSSKYRDIDSCKSFIYKRCFPFSICESDKYSYGRGNNLLNHMQTPDETGVNSILSRFVISAVKFTKDSTEEDVEMITIVFGSYCFRFYYNSNQVQYNIPGRNISMHSDSCMFSDNSGYSELYSMRNRNYKMCAIKVNSPIFTPAVCKFLHVLCKIKMWEENNFEKTYSTSIINRNHPESFYIDQLLLKHLFIENNTINQALAYLNTTRPRTYHYSPDTVPPAVYLSYIIPSGRQQYDTYSNDKLYNMMIEERFPMWLDLLNRPFLENVFLIHDYMLGINETPQDAEIRRNSDSRHYGNTIHTMIDSANLKGQAIFQELVDIFNKSC